MHPNFRSRQTRNRLIPQSFTASPGRTVNVNAPRWTSRARRMRTAVHTSLLLISFACAPAPTSTPEPTATLQRESRVEASTFTDKVTAGYQAWFACPTDGVSHWTHWAGQTPAPGRVTFELYPDVREYDQSALCDTNLGPLGNGQRSRLYNASSESVIDTHFRWMEEYGIDGVGLQRFVVGLYGDKRHGNLITTRVRAAAERHGRIFYVMYDISGAHESDWVQTIERDWEETMLRELHVTDSAQYARQDGRAVVNVWGLGVGDRPGTAQQTLELIRWFKSRNVYVVGGVPYWWRQAGGGKPGFEAAYAALDMVQPWAVGTFGTEGDADAHFADLVANDLSLTQSRGQAYQRVLWSGFAWSNWNGGARNAIPRRAGRFFWRQAYLTARARTGAYIAMFDEYDEGTAIAKAAEDSSQTPRDQYFLSLDADGERVSSDFYLRLAGAATQMINGSRSVTERVPVPTNPTPTPTPTPTPGAVPSDAVRFEANATLARDARLTTRDGRFTLVYQGDGNLVLYASGAALWASNTSGTSAGRVTMQGDGNLVITDASGRPVWATNTSGNAGAFLALLADGGLAVYRRDGQAMLWSRAAATPTPSPTTAARLEANQQLVPDARLTSRDGRFALVYQGDGNLVLYGPTGATWASHTQGIPQQAVMQGDGNLVVYARDGRPVWSSGTVGKPGAFLELGDDGSLVVRDTSTIHWKAVTR